MRSDRRPRCYNREPYKATRTVHGIDQQTGERIAATLSIGWYTDRCATWDGDGIGPPTADHPTGTPYPMAHGWDCNGCRWLPGWR